MDSRVPRLISLEEGQSSGAFFELSGKYLTLGRSASNDLLLSDSSVSRTHAGISIDEEGCVWVTDLGSTAGTRVNGRFVTTSTILRPGDVVAFGGLRFRLDAANQQSDATVPLPDQKRSPGISRPVDTQGQGQYDIESQRAHSISNVAGDHYTSHVQHVKRERESFLREIAATKTRARWLIWTGVAVTVFGILLFLFSSIQFFDFIVGIVRNPAGLNFSAEFLENMSPTVFGGIGMGIVGSILMIVGIILHVTATSRRSQLDGQRQPPER